MFIGLSPYLQAHTNIELIDYLSEKVTENPKVLQDCRPNSLLSLVTGLSNTNYRPAGWDLMQDIILTNDIILEVTIYLGITLQYKHQLVYFDLKYFINYILVIIFPE